RSGAVEGDVYAARVGDGLGQGRAHHDAAARAEQRRQGLADLRRIDVDGADALEATGRRALSRDADADLAKAIVKYPELSVLAHIVFVFLRDRPRGLRPLLRWGRWGPPVRRCSRGRGR